MSEPRHLRPRRRRGLTIRGSAGKRRQSGVLEDSQTARELNRAARRTSRRQARRRMLVAIVLGSLIVAGAILISLVFFGSDETSPSTTLALSPEGASALVVVVDDEGRASSTTLFGAHPDFVSEVTLFPPALLTTIPGFGEGLLGNTTRFGGGDLSQLTVQNMLGVRIDGTTVHDPASFAAAIGGPLEVDVPNPLIVESDGAEIILVGEGPALRSPQEMATLLTVQGTGDQLAWLVRQGAVWEAVLDAAAEDPTIAAALGVGAPSGTERSAATIALAASGDRNIGAAPVDRVERAGGGVEFYQLTGASDEEFTAVRLPYLELRPPPRPRIEILNGNGLVGTTQVVSDVLINDGFWVIRTDNADNFSYETTLVIAQGRENQDFALEVQRLLSLGDVEVQQRQPSGVVDVTIIVGQDLPAGSSEGP